MSIRVPLRFFAAEELIRTGEPVTVGLPWPRGAVTDDLQFRLIGPPGEVPFSTGVLDRWPDGSVRWCLFDFRADWPAEYAVEVRDTPRDRGAGDRPESGLAFADWFLAGFEVTFPDGIRTVPRFARKPYFTGPVREALSFYLEESLRGLHVFGFIETFAGLAATRVSVTIRNPHAADHPGGNWDLGTEGSAYLAAVELRLALPDGVTATRADLSLNRGEAPRPTALPFEIRQASSGGANSYSLNHLDAHRNIAIEFNGYKLFDGERTTGGDRATPTVVLPAGDDIRGVAVPHFWQNFPMAVAADTAGITLGLFPPSPTGPHELQGGEQKTHTFWVLTGPDTVTAEPLAWARSPLTCHADPAWYAASGAVPYLTPKAADPNAAYLALADQAIAGPDTFFDKREKIDEYGWRNFGDIYGDHEAVHHPGPAPMVSHYNNQYDCVAAFLLQFLRSGDPKWLDLAIPCADHTVDIDIYHTTQDKAAYNGGLFWHTYHYAPADTGTHRSYPRSLRQGPQDSQTAKMDQLGATAEKLKKAYAVGGGPASSHNYNAGLMLAYFLTGNPQYYDAAVDLAYFVVRMEDPSTTPFRFLSFRPTGAATESGGGGYHGPGRASANSVLALLVGHQLTKDDALLAKAEELIRRVSSPNQNLASLDLLNAELRWFYTMFLQALGRYLDYKIELGQLDRPYAYARLTLLHYARWMAVHERPILDAPEKLQYPTETWAAQDLRKVEVFQYAAKHAAGDEKARFLERADFFFRYVERTLPTFGTKSLCRPVVLCCKYGWSRAWWQQNPTASAPEPGVAVEPEEFGPWSMFVGQKQVAMKRAKAIVAAGGLAFVSACAFGLAYLLGAFR